MRLSPMLVFHILTGTIGCLSGFLAVFLRKGSRGHVLAGQVFAVSMLCLAASGVSLAVTRSTPGNIFGGSLTFYLVATAWRTARRRDGNPNLYDWIGLVAVFALSASVALLGVEAATSPSGLKYGYSFGPYAFLGIVGVLATVGDVRMIARGGISGRPRIARHLWRMCFAFFIASASIFLARAHVFPAILRTTGVLYLLSVLPLLLMVFWLVRIRFKDVFEKVILPTRSHAFPQSQ